MNKISFLLLLTCSIVSSNCQTVKTPVHKVEIASKHFKVINSTYKKWNGGQPTIKGYLLSFAINNPEITPDTLYFRNQKAIVKLNVTTQKYTFEGSFVLPKKPDFILHENPVNEYQNQVPSFTQNIPFQLQNDEAVFHYKFQNKSYYYKISGLKEEI